MYLGRLFSENLINMQYDYYEYIYHCLKGLASQLYLNIALKMSNFFHQTEYKNGNHNESNDLLYNQTMMLEFALFDKKIEKKLMSTGSTGSFQSIEIGNKFSWTFDNVFHVYLMRRLKKNAKIFFSRWLFFKSTLSVLRCTWMAG